MSGRRSLFAVLLVCSLPAERAGSTEAVPLCPLAAEIEEGARRHVEVAAILVRGRENIFLYDPRCKAGAPMTWIEFDLESDDLKRRLDRVLKKSGRARVEVRGEIWGPRAPDPDAPELVRRYSPRRWGHLNGYRTRLVVHRILRVETVPEGVPHFQRPAPDEGI